MNNETRICNLDHYQQLSKWPNKQKREARPFDREATREYHRRYLREHRQRINELSRQWARRNREKKQANCRRRRSKYVGYLSPEAWMEIKKRYGFKCLACGRPETLIHRLEADHIVPVSKGGTSDPDNIQPLCRSCNPSKGAKIIDYRPKPEPAHAD